MILARYLPMYRMMDRLAEIKVPDWVSCESGLWLDTQSFIIGYSYNNTSNSLQQTDNTVSRLDLYFEIKIDFKYHPNIWTVPTNIFFYTCFEFE